MNQADPITTLTASIASQRKDVAEWGGKVFEHSANAMREAQQNPKGPTATLAETYRQELTQLLAGYDNVRKAADAYAQDKSDANKNGVIETAETLEQSIDTLHLKYAKAFFMARPESATLQLVDGIQGDLAGIGSALDKALAGANPRHESRSGQFSRDRKDARDPLAEAASQAVFKLEDMQKEPFVKDKKSEEFNAALDNALKATTTLRDAATNENREKALDAIAGAEIAATSLPTRLQFDAKLKAIGKQLEAARQGGAATEAEQDRAPKTKPPLARSKSEFAASLQSVRKEVLEKGMGKLPPMAKNDFEQIRTQAATLEADPYNGAQSVQLMTMLQRGARDGFPGLSDEANGTIKKRMQDTLDTYMGVHPMMEAANTGAIATYHLTSDDEKSKPLKQALEKVKTAATELTTDASQSGKLDKEKAKTLNGALDDAIEKSGNGNSAMKKDLQEEKRKLVPVLIGAEVRDVKDKLALSSITPTSMEDKAKQAPRQGTSGNIYLS